MSVDFIPAAFLVRKHADVRYDSVVIVIIP